MAVQDEVPKSRLTLRYRTEVNGVPEDVNLPMRMLVMGDFSGGTSSDRKVDLEERKLRTLDGKNTNGIMKDMKMALSFSVPNKIDPQNAEELEINLAVDSLKAFSPDEIAKRIPKLKGLMLLKKLLVEVESNVANAKDFRKLLGDLYGNEEQYKKLLEQLKGYEGYKIPDGKDAAK
jgi:type VI secretion system protein ImpB